VFLEFYRLKEQPFGVTPDPHYLYLGKSHREALASLFYGVKTGRGLLALIAQPGMGKTTLLFRFLEHMRRSARTAFLFQTQCDSNGLLHYLLRDLGINTQGQDFVTMHDRLNTILLQEAHAGRRFVLVIDEAQNLDDSVLETARLLSDFETPNEKLLQIVFAGQPQLAQKLGRPELVQLRQRISILGHLRPFSPTEVNDYIDHRLRVAGHSGEKLFAPPAVESIAFRSRGIPRNINNICFNALSLGCALGRKQIDEEMIGEVTADLELSSLTDSRQSEVQSIGSSAQPRAKDTTGADMVTFESGLATQAQPADDRHDIQRDAIAACEGKSNVVLELWEEAERRGAEILAEVVGCNRFVEAAIPRPVRDQAEIHPVASWLEDSPHHTPVIDAASTLTPDGQRGKQLQASSANEITSTFRSNKAPGSPISYASQKESKIERWTLVAATFVLIVSTAIFYRQNMQALATRTRQTVVTLASLCSSRDTIRIGSKLINASAKRTLAATRVEWTKQGLFVKAVAPPLVTSIADEENAPLLEAPDGPRTTFSTVAAVDSPALARARIVGGITVIVQTNDDLRRICLRHLGRFDERLIEEIRELNPEITNPDHVTVGQRILLSGSIDKNNNISASAKPEL
jgi:type II secretory pathway predicted ATPase ExeA